MNDIKSADLGKDTMCITEKSARCRNMMYAQRVDDMLKKHGVRTLQELMAFINKNVTRDSKEKFECLVHDYSCTRVRI